MNEGDVQGVRLEKIWTWFSEQRDARYSGMPEEIKALEPYMTSEGKIHFPIVTEEDEAKKQEWIVKKMSELIDKLGLNNPEMKMINKVNEAEESGNIPWYGRPHAPYMFQTIDFYEVRERWLELINLNKKTPFRKRKKKSKQAYHSWMECEFLEAVTETVKDVNDINILDAVNVFQRLYTEDYLKKHARAFTKLVYDGPENDHIKYFYFADDVPYQITTEKRIIN